MKIGLLGFGTVGKGVYEIIKNKLTCFLDDIEIKRILVKSEEEKVMDIITTSAEEILNDDEIDLIVEVMGGIEPAHEYILKALNNGKHVVTANKAVIAKYLKEFTEKALEKGVSFEYEASVCGGIPWLKSIEKVRRIDEISEVGGIFNGTTNFILDNMNRTQEDFAPILKEAQNLGYAEADPSADIDGIDIMRKLIITSALAFDTIIDEKDISLKGIRNITNGDIKNFQELGYTVKLIALTVKKENKYCATIEPVLYPKDRVEANIPLNFNLGTLKGTTIGELKFYGQGAGKLPTGNAVVQDIIDISLNNKNKVRNFSQKLEKDETLISGKYYVRFDNKKDKKFADMIIENYAEKTADTSYGFYCITKKISSDDMRKLAEKYVGNDLFYARIEE